MDNPSVGARPQADQALVNEAATHPHPAGFDPSRECDVCRRERELFVCGSGLGPISWAYCEECLNKPAEPACMIAATLDGCGGLDGIAAWARQVWTWLDGAYVSFDDAAIAIEARSGETGTGSTEGESAAIAQGAKS